MSNFASRPWRRAILWLSIACWLSLSSGCPKPEVQLVALGGEAIVGKIKDGATTWAAELGAPQAGTEYLIVTKQLINDYYKQLYLAAKYRRELDLCLNQKKEK